MFRKILFWTHLITGVVAGLVILIMSVTGVLLMYEKQMVAYVDRRAAAPGMASAGSTQSARMGVEALLANVRDTSGAVPTNITLRADAKEPYTVVLGRDAVLVDPATGNVLAPQQAEIRAFFRSVTDWHRWLGVGQASGPEARTRARAITGASNLAFLFIVVSGLYLWLPRKWKWNNVKSVLLFRGGLSGKARDFNWHNVAGFWCCVPLFFVVLSGVVISYPWASAMVYTVQGLPAPAQGKGKDKGAKGGEGKGIEARGKSEGRGGERGPERVREASLVNLDALVAQVQKHEPEWRTIAFPVPTADDAPITFNVDTSFGGQPQKRSTLTLDRATAQVTQTTSFATQNAGQRARSWMRFVHTGEYYGVAGQTIAGIASAGGALLVWTGIALAFRRFRAWMERDRRRAVTAKSESETVAA